MGRFNAKTRYEYRIHNCIYCQRCDGCQVMAQHDRYEGDPEKAAELHALIPWDGRQNGRCREFAERGET